MAKKIEARQRVRRSRERRRGVRKDVPRGVRDERRRALQRHGPVALRRVRGEREHRRGERELRGGDDIKGERSDGEVRERCGAR